MTWTAESRISILSQYVTRVFGLTFDRDRTEHFVPVRCEKYSADQLR